MECNRDEALRSKVLAEEKFLQRDYRGAKKLAYKARQLYADLDGLAYFIYVLDVHIVAQDKLQTGEYNWYGILEVDPSADENIIRKQFRRLALLLHPDKNKAVGAEAAFKYISEAWTLLSDKNKKAAYDARCQGKTQTPGGRPSQQNSEPNTSSKPAASNMTAFIPPFQRDGQTDGNQAPPSHPEPTAKGFLSAVSAPFMFNGVFFWTSCPSCRMLLEYQRVYLLKNLCCPVCLRPFIAMEVSAVRGTLLWPLPPEHHRTRVDTFRNGFKPAVEPKGGFPVPHFESFLFCNAKAGHSAHVPTPNIPQQDKLEKAEGGCAIPQKLTPDFLQQRVAERILDVKSGIKNPITETSFWPKQKRTRKNLKKNLKAREDAIAKDVTKSLLAKLRGAIEQRLFMEKERKMEVDSVEMSRPSPVTTDASNSKTNKLKSAIISETKLDDADKSSNCIGKSLRDLSEKSLEGKWAATTLGNDKEDIFSPFKKLKKDTDSALNNSQLKTCAGSRLNGIGDTFQTDESLETTRQMNSVRNNSSTEKNSQTSSSSKKNPDFVAAPIDSDVPLVVRDTITVPDSEFYDFDKDRTDGHFMPGQVWAAYDDGDSMPRYYAKVNKIISSQPFKIQIAWLEARSTSDETLAWLDSGFSLTCGEFRVGKSILSNRVSMFSHMMKFEKGQRGGGFRIYPHQGDIWAMYKNWENLRANDGKPMFIVVEVLRDFHEKEGVQVCHLEKRDGYKTLFQRQIGVKHCEWIHILDMRRFSHQIPAYHLTSGQQLGITENIWELDPASTPLELFSEEVVGWDCQM